MIFLKNQRFEDFSVALVDSDPADGSSAHYRANLESKEGQRFYAKRAVEHIDKATDNLYNLKEVFASHLHALLTGDNTVIKSSLIEDKDGNLFSISREEIPFKNSHRYVPRSLIPENFAAAFYTSILIGDIDGGSNLTNVCHSDKRGIRSFKRLDFEKAFNFDSLTLINPFLDKWGDTEIDGVTIDVNQHSDWYKPFSDPKTVKTTLLSGEYILTSHTYLDWATSSQDHYNLLKSLHELDLGKVKKFFEEAGAEIGKYISRLESSAWFDNGIKENYHYIQLKNMLTGGAEKEIISRLEYIKEKFPELEKPAD